jgi:hypothetical protein
MHFLGGVWGLHLLPGTGAQILDVLDGTGSGDVDMSKVVRADEEGCIMGVFGNKLHVNTAWSNPTGMSPACLGCMKLVTSCHELLKC